MSLRTILVPLVGGSHDKATLSAGMVIAQLFGAHIEVCFTRPDPDAAVPYLGLATENLEDVKEDYRQRAELTGEKGAAKARRLFRSACKKHGFEIVKEPRDTKNNCARWSVVVGRATQTIPELARLSDLTVFAGPITDYHRLYPNVLEQTLLASGRPVLFVPGDPSTLSLDRVCIAWDDKTAAARAVYVGMGFFRKAVSILVLSVSELFEDAADPQRLVNYLTWHGLDAKGALVESTHHNVRRALLDAAEKSGATLLVMGGYTHDRFEEAIFGGTTLNTILHTEIPVLLMH